MLDILIAIFWYGSKYSTSCHMLCFGSFDRQLAAKMSLLCEFCSVCQASLLRLCSSVDWNIFKYSDRDKSIVQGALSLLWQRAASKPLGKTWNPYMTFEYPKQDKSISKKIKYTVKEYHTCWSGDGLFGKTEAMFWSSFFSINPAAEPGPTLVHVLDRLLKCTKVCWKSPKRAE